MSEVHEEIVTQAVTDRMIKRVFQVANILAAAKRADTDTEAAENHLKNQLAVEVGYGEADRKTQPA
ncbi:MAG: hypothetical protein IAE80_15550 [Anaerolinea sp.]|jgi:hypothetical protein|nr:hypothetical protein [Anaerolinea sp.]